MPVARRRDALDTDNTLYFFDNFHIGSEIVFFFHVRFFLALKNNPVGRRLKLQYDKMK